MSPRTLATAFSSIVAALVLGACRADDSAHAAASVDAGACAAPPTSIPEGGTTSPEAGSPGGVAKVRLFNFVGPHALATALDFCLQPADATTATAWSGPMYRNTHTYARYAKVAPYVDVAPGRYRVRAVPWGSAECESTIAGTESDLELPMAFEADTLRTLVLGGWLVEGKNGVPRMPLSVRVLDDRKTFGPRQLSVRFLNMDPAAGGIDVWKAPRSRNDDPATWQLVMEAIPFGEVGQAAATSPFGATDAQGYLTQSPGDWPESIVQLTILCPHGKKTECTVLGMQELEGNMTFFGSRTNAAPPWAYNYVSDGEKLFGTNQPHMVLPGATDW